MGREYEAIDERLSDFIRAQHVFFVSSAPLDASGHINVSPKGLDSFRILAPTRVAYLDLVGSGIETVSHLRENGRIALLFCAFAGPPKTLRLYGTGRVVEPADAEWAGLAPQFPDYLGARSIIVVDVTRIADSCGYGVPLYSFQGDRRQLRDWADRKGEHGLHEYQCENNLRSIDGLPGLQSLEPRSTR